MRQIFSGPTVFVILVLLLTAPVAKADDSAPESAGELLEQALAAQRNDPTRSLSLASQALEGALKSGELAIQCRALSTMGVAHYYLGEYPEALDFYQQCLTLAEETDNLAAQAGALNNIGIIHFVWGQHDEALSYYYRTVSLQSDRGDQDGLARAYNNVANVYQTAGNYDQSLEFYNKALEIHVQGDNQAMVAATHNNIGLLHFDRGNLKVSKTHFEKALQLEEEIDDKPGMALSMNNLGQVMVEQGNLDAALDFYRRAQSLREELGDKQGISVCLHNQGEVFSRLGQYSQAVDYLNRALAIAEELEVQELIRNGLEGLAKAYEQWGDAARALDYYRRYKEAHDDLFSEERTRQMAAAEARYQVDIKDREISALKREKETEEFRRRLLLVVAALSLGILFLLLNRYLFQKRANNRIRLANAALRQAHTDLATASRDELSHVARVATMGELAGAFAHELNQPLAAIRVNVRAGRNFLDRSEPDAGETLAALGDIGSDAERAQKIISRLRSMMQKGEMRTQPVDLNRVVVEATGFVEGESKKLGLEVIHELATELPMVLGDRIQLQQVVLNLIQNALGVMADQPAQEVVVSTEAGPHENVVLKVRDAGPKISDDVFNDMFEPFFTTRDGGLGMGLPICRTIVEAHGGHIEVQRNADRGLTFQILLPLDLSN